MVSKITRPTSLRNMVMYNENKVRDKKATCLHAANYLKEAHEMTVKEKMARIRSNIELSKAKTNLLHITLNFDAADKMDPGKMITIANDYMQQIGFGKQPYLVYQHHDAGHDHCHIVTTNIKDDGKRIDTFNIGKNLSEPARKAIEIKYGLTKAEGKKQPVPNKEAAQKIEYGKSHSTESVARVIDAVINTYKYASLAELNAVLRLYNVEADRGKEGSRTFAHRGLYYRILDQEGKKIGVPIKASALRGNPTLDNLEKKFAANAILKAQDKPHLKTAIDWTLAQYPKSLKDFVDRLRQEQIDVVVRLSEKGQLYGLTYVDHHTKSVMNGSELGKKYAAKGIQEQLNIAPAKTPAPQKEIEKSSPQPESSSSSKSSFQLLDHLLRPESNNESIALELREEEKKRKRRSPDRDNEMER